ncbi:regulator of G-protein signaling 22 [Pholidichthys leucotaenia]
MLAQYFNGFLSLPLFSEAVMYNQQTGLFEVANGAAESVTRRIRSALLHSRSVLSTGDPAKLAGTPLVDNHYTFYSLDSEQGIQWIKTQRLPFFLQSDCYCEYRLVKLLLQWDSNLCIQKRKSSATPLSQCFQFSKESSGAQTVLTLSHPIEDRSVKQGTGSINTILCLPSRHIGSKRGDSSRCYSSWSEPESLSTFSSSSGFSSAHLKCEDTRELLSSQSKLSLLNTRTVSEKYHKDSSSQIFGSPAQQLEYLPASVIEQVLKDKADIMDRQSKANICLQQQQHKAFSTSLDKVNFRSTGGSSEHSADEERDTIEGKNQKGQDGRRHMKRGEESLDAYQENVLDIYCHCLCCHSNRPGLDEFKKFLQGTPGEKLLNLWMDIERLKAIQHRERKNRYLALMRSWYLSSSSHRSLNMELLSRLGLTTSPCWTEAKLHSVQPCLTESLLHYWAPRFWTSQCVQEDCSGSPHVRTRANACDSALASIEPYHDSTILPIITPETCYSQFFQCVSTQSILSRSWLQSNRGIENMLQALYTDSCAGLYFTHFCEQSGNQLWVNAVYFWTDLQHYHELFHQDRVDPYRVQREAQLLYSTYLFSSARTSIGVDEEMRMDVYDRLIPAFEELFDDVEAHTLNILLEPWTLLITRDTESFQQVCVQEEVHYIDSPDYRELKSLHEESEQQLKQVEQCSSTSFPSSFRPSSSCALNCWSSASPCYRGYHLGSLLRHRHEIGHFMSFLQSQGASIHLMCWLDLEEYRRTPRRDQAVRQQRSSRIATRYLNRKYFFGSNSPATTEQQNSILCLAGGLERLRLDCISNPVVMEIQDIARSYIEKTWLPLFVSTPEFTKRQKNRPKPQAADGLSQHNHRRGARREAWKAEGLRMSSSKEILLLRRILLNPVTCQQFQLFMSLKGDFLENDVLFWLEVQRYKDLCHSHSDDATIQQKISTIISCFINSSTPPLLQIDIPPQQAQHILEKRHELGPYIFREAQISVFSELLKFWPEFQELTNNVEEKQLIPLLQEKRIKHRARVRRQRRRDEEDQDQRRKAEEESERQESSFQEETSDDDDHDGGDVGEEMGSEKSRILSRVQLKSTQLLSWSYSKYLAALNREEVLLRRRSQRNTSLSTSSDASSDCSVSKRSYRQSSQCSYKTDSRHSNGHNSK